MKILLAVDDSATSYEAALVVSQWFGDDASIVALHVGTVTPTLSSTEHLAVGGSGYPVFALPALRERMTEITRAAREVAARAANLTDGSVRTEQGDPADVIVAVAAEIDADLIVVGTGDRSWLSRLLNPSVSSTVAEKAPCSVLVVRSGALGESTLGESTLGESTVGEPT
ncbi:MAG: universal stress protein [Acidimicrobiales bacterium]